MNLSLKHVGRRQPGYHSARWEVQQIPGLYLLKEPHGWLAAATLQQRSLAYRVWHSLAHQRFQTRREALQAVEMVLQVNREKLGA